MTDISWDSVMRLVLLAARQVSKLMALDAYNVRWKVRPYMLVSGTPEVATELPAWKLLGGLLARSSTYTALIPREGHRTQAAEGKVVYRETMKPRDPGQPAPAQEKQ